jgi:hypothetical protein
LVPGNTPNPVGETRRLSGESLSGVYLHEVTARNRQVEQCLVARNLDGQLEHGGATKQ